MKSTDTASQTFIAGIQKAMELHLHVVGIFLDLTKAYDVLNHNTALDKLNTYGIIGNTNLWFRPYLSNCSHFFLNNPNGTDILHSTDIQSHTGK
jgi:hypothetical protein